MALLISDGQNRQRLLAGILFSLVWLFVCHYDAPLIGEVEGHLQDWMVESLLADSPASPVTIVDIDDRTLQAVGQWPWPRYIFADLLAQLRSRTDEVIGLDILFPEGDRTSLNRVGKRFNQEFGDYLNLASIPKPLQDNDAIFARALTQFRPVVGAAQMLFSGESAQPCQKVEATLSLLQLPCASYVLGNVPVLRQAMSAQGVVNALDESDGILRRSPLLINSPNGPVAGLALAMIMQQHHLTQLQAKPTLFGPELVVGSYHIPVDKDAQAWLNFSAHHHRHTTLSAIDVLTGDALPAPGSVLLIGSSAAALHDDVITSFSMDWPGTEVHATLLDNILTHTLLRYPSWLSLWYRLLAGVLCLAVTFVMLGHPVRRIAIGVSAILLLPCIVTTVALHAFHLWLPVLFPLLGACLQIALLSGINALLLYRKTLIWRQDLSHTNQIVMRTMAAMCESRDSETGAHIIRTQHYVQQLANYLHENGHPEARDPMLAKKMFHAALLHDVGKVAIPDAVLLKPGKLTPEEFEVMKTHALKGRLLLERVCQDLHAPGEFIQRATEIAGSHHERWDGKGYPQGIAGTAIPFSARIMAVADVYDALVGKRIYKPSMPHGKAVGIIRDGRAAHFDPDVVDAFIALEDKFRDIAQTFLDD